MSTCQRPRGMARLVSTPRGAGGSSWEGRVTTMPHCQCKLILPQSEGVQWNGWRMWVLAWVTSGCEAWVPCGLWAVEVCGGFEHRRTPTLRVCVYACTVCLSGPTGGDTHHHRHHSHGTVVPAIIHHHHQLLSRNGVPFSSSHAMMIRAQDGGDTTGPQAHKIVDCFHDHRLAARDSTSSTNPVQSSSPG
jgi:hypothetical protein